MRRDVRFVPVVEVAERYEAELIRGLLDAEEIPSAVRTDDAGGIYPDLTASTGVAVLVPEERAAEARAIVAAARDERAEVVETGSGRLVRGTTSPSHPTARSRRSALGWVVAALLLAVVVLLVLRDASLL